MATQRRNGVTVQQITPCADCGGRGIVIDTPCTECHGQGTVEREETLTVKIPPGIEEGMALRIPGHGQPGVERGSPAGDLYVVVYSAPDPRFERRGADLYHTTTVGVAAATLGTTVTIPTLEGPTDVTIPPGTQPDTLLRLRGKGLPEFGSARRGDLYVVVRVHVPERLSPEQRKLYQRLAALEK